MKVLPARLLLILSVLAFSQSALADSESARLALKARKAQRAKEFTEAYLLYSRAAALDPSNKGYRAKVNFLSAKVASHARPDAQPMVPDPGATLDPAAVFDDLASLNLKPPPELHARPGRVDINLIGDYRTVFIQLAGIFKLDCVFDSDFDGSKPLHFVINQADYREALEALSAVTGSFVVPVSDGLFIVAKDTPQKRTDLEQTTTVTVPIPQYIAVQELVEIAQAVRQASDVSKMSWDNKTGSIIMRDRVSHVIPAQQILYSLFSFRPEVMIDLQLIELSRTDVINFGLTLPNIFNIAFTGQQAASSSSALSSSTSNPFPFNSLSYIYTALASQSGSAVAQSIVRGLFPTSLSVFSISLGEANALVNFSNGNGKTIFSENIRSVDGQPATFHYGERYPIVTGSYANTTTVGSQYVPTASFKFEDIGVSLKVTPHIHGMEAVSMDVESEFKLLTGSTVNGNPVISNRQLKSTVSLTNGEWAMVAGLEQKNDSRTVTGTAGLSNIPIISEIFSEHMKEKDRTEILILMRPHLLSLPGNQTVRKAVWVGTETHPHTPL